jgi:hypothetical protein
MKEPIAGFNCNRSEPICIPNTNAILNTNRNNYSHEYQYENINFYVDNVNKFNFDKQYSLKENKFDPIKFSPPQNFMIKLHMRMNNYASVSLGINDINRNSE